MDHILLALPTERTLPQSAIQMAYLANWEGIPYRTRLRLADGRIVVASEETGVLSIPWLTTTGTFVLSTGSLRPSERPYWLDVELARGTVHRVREFIAQCQMRGFSVAPSFTAALCEAQQLFLDSLTWRPVDLARSVAAAQKAIDLCTALIPGLVRHVAQQSLELRQRHCTQLPTLLAGRMEIVPGEKKAEQEFLSAFNVAALAASWRDVQSRAGSWQWQELDRRLDWCHQQGIRVGLGPLLTADAYQLPEWLYLWQDDFSQLAGSIREYLEAVVSHCRGRVHFWHVASGLNVPGGLDLDEEQRLQLVADAICTVRRLDGTTPVIITVDQPWGEYLATSSFDLPPLYFAESLVRAGLGLAGVGIEFHLGYWPHGTAVRDLLQFVRQLECWATLECPLLVVLTIPSDSVPDDRAWQKDSCVYPADGQFTPETQKRWAEDLLALLLAHPCVHGILWNQGSDATSHRWPHGGLWDRNGQAKPALSVVRQMRKQWLT